MHDIRVYRRIGEYDISTHGRACGLRYRHYSSAYDWGIDSYNSGNPDRSTNREEGEIDYERLDEVSIVIFCRAFAFSQEVAVRVRSLIVFGLSITGLICGGIFAEKAVDNYKKRSEARENNVLKTVKDVIIPVACIGAAGIIATNEIRNLYSENQAYATTYLHNKDKLDRIQTNGIDVFGNKRWSGFMDEFYADYLYSDLIRNHKPIMTGFGGYLCYDTVNKFYFRSNIEQLRRSEGKIIDQLKSGKKFVSVNEFYKMNKLPPIPECEFVGWKKPEDVDFTHSIHMAGGEPCCIMCYEPVPKYILRKENL